jgi:hypothetical protein
MAKYRGDNQAERLVDVTLSQKEVDTIRAALLLDNALIRDKSIITRAEVLDRPEQMDLQTFFQQVSEGRVE